MILLELALLGVRNFQQITRFEFCPGLNFVQGGNGSGKTTLRDALLFSLFDHTPEESEKIIHRSCPSTCQSAITFKIKNGEVYRLAKDFIKNVGILSKYDPSTRKFITIEKRRENVLRWLQQVCGGLEGHQISYYFSLDRSRLPSVSAGRIKTEETSSFSAMGGPIGHSKVDVAFGPESQENTTRKLKRLQELKALAEKAEQVYQLEEQLSDAQSRVGILKRKLSDLKEVDWELEQINEKIGAFTGLEGTPEHLRQLVEEFEEKLGERNREHRTLEEDRTLLEHQISMIPAGPIYKRKAFLMGALATSLSFGAGLFVSLSGIYQHLYLVGLLMGLGFMAASIIVDARWLSRKKILADKLHGKLKNMELLEARFRRVNAKFFELLKKTHTDSVQAFKEKMNAYDLLSATHQRLLEESKRVLEGKEPPALQQEYEEKSGLVQEIEREIKNYHEIPPDLPSLYEEIRAVEKELASASGGRGQASLQQSASGGSGEVTQPSDGKDIPANYGNGLHDPIKMLLQDPLVRSHGQVSSTAREIFTKLSLGAYRDLMILDSSTASSALGGLGGGRVGLFAKDSSDPVPLEELSSGTLDQVFISLYLGFLMTLGHNHPFPLLLDDPLLTLDPQRQKIVLDILRDLSQKRQVILLSHMPYPIRDGERQIRLI